jgi:hypothetical protein
MKIMKPSAVLLLAFTLTTAACSSSSSSSSTDGGGTGGALGTGAGGGGGSNSCGDTPACVANLFSGCMTSGTCVSQTDLTTFSSNTCYSNGTKSMTTFDLATGNAMLRIVKSNGTTCLTVNVVQDSSGNSTGTIKNAAGTTVATETDIIDPDGGAEMVTISCGGQTYHVTDPGSCGMSSTTCTDGTCP